ncbi:hypothetical protein DFH06DRAFT_270303 [Mycena polygramma]|nr:hypothetical protein DFH06DRAFT_270303 [Mycena polygramma]
MATILPFLLLHLPLTLVNSLDAATYTARKLRVSGTRASLLELGAAASLRLLPEYLVEFEGAPEPEAVEGGPEPEPEPDAEFEGARGAGALDEA